MANAYASDGPEMDLKPLFGVCSAGILSGTARAVTPWGWLPPVPARHHADRNSSDLIWQFLILQ